MLLENQFARHLQLHMIAEAFWAVVVVGRQLLLVWVQRWWLQASVVLLQIRKHLMERCWSVVVVEGLLCEALFHTQQQPVPAWNLVRRKHQRLHVSLEHQLLELLLLAQQ